MSFEMMKYLSIAFLLATSFRNGVDAAKRGKSKTVPQKANAGSDADERLRSLSAKFINQQMVPLTDSNYSKFIILRPRDYVAVIMFTALGSRYECTVCKATLPIFADVANLYYSQYNFNTSEPKDRLAFFIVDADKAGRTFEDMKLETVPKFYVLPPRSESDSKLKMSDFEISNRYVTNECFRQ